MDNVKKAAGVGEHPWWVGEGEIASGRYVPLGEELVTAAQIQAAAGITHEVHMAPAHINIPEGPMALIPNMFGIYRSDNLEVLGSSTNRYEIVQPQRCFDFFDDVVRPSNGGPPPATYEMAGQIDGGRIIWILARLPEDIIVNGHDVLRNYLLMANGYVPGFSFRFMNTRIRTVCENTLNIALQDRSGYRQRHLKGINAALNVADARRALGFAQEEALAFGEAANRLGQQAISEEEVLGLVQRLFPVPALPSAATPAERVLNGSLLLLPEPRAEDYTPPVDFTNIQRKRELVTHLYREGKGNDAPAVAGTRWAAFNAVAEYTDYLAGWESKRPRELLFGSGADLKQQAWNILTRAPE